MGSTGWRDSAPLKQLLEERPSLFEFFQAVRVLRKLYPERRGVGRHADPRSEVVRFRSDVSAVFPKADLCSLELHEDAPAEMTVAFLGVATPASFGSLPNVYAQLVRELRGRNPALRDFLDLLNHRLLSLFYRAWEKYQLPIRFELGDPENSFETTLYALLGLETGGLRGRQRLEDPSLLARAGLLTMAPVPASALEGLVETFFGAAARVVPFRSRWFAIEEEERSRLGLANSRLAEDLVLGESARLVQSCFRLRIGPLDRRAYEHLLPSGGGFVALGELLRLATCDELEAEVQLVLRGEDVPPLRLGGDPARGPRLGWTTWLAQTGPVGDRDDAILGHARAA